MTGVQLRTRHLPTKGQLRSGGTYHWTTQRQPLNWPLKAVLSGLHRLSHAMHTHTRARVATLAPNNDHLVTSENYQIWPLLSIGSVLCADILTGISDVRPLSGHKWMTEGYKKNRYLTCVSVSGSLR